MRIRRLEIEGFGPFAEQQVIDFDRLDEAGVFLITGRTGSGKSSILDAICFALYGSAPRYDGAQARLRSDHAAPGTPSRVVLELAVGDERWRVTRSPEHDRPKRRGDGVTREPHTASLERWTGSEWAGVAARPVDVAEHLAPVLRLTREQFLQVILLAQGRFQEFLKAPSENRLGLLRALFGTDRFQRFEAEVTERAKALEQAVGARSQTLRESARWLADLAGTEPPVQQEASWATEAATALADAVVAAESEASAAGEVFAAADRAAGLAAAVADRQRRRAGALATLDRLDAERDAVERARTRAADAVRVLPVLPAVQSADRAAAALPLAEQAVADARIALGEEVADPAAAGAELDGVLGTLVERLEEEQALPGLDRAAQRADTARAEAEHALAALTDEHATLPERRREHETARAAAEAVLAGASGAEEALGRAERLVRAVAQEASTATAQTAAEQALERALAAEQLAVGRTRALLSARLAGAAGLLAAELRDDEPCAVCGSTAHPHPAEQDAATPDAAAVEAAEGRQQEAARARAAASEAAAAARSAHSAAAADAGGATDAQAEAALRDARTAVEAVRDATGARDRAAQAIRALDDHDARLQTSIATATTAVQQRIADAATAATARRAAEARTTSALAGHASVADRVAALRRRRTDLQALETAEQRRDQAHADDREARERLRAALASAGVPDAETARAAHLPGPEREALEQRVRAWEQEVGSARSVLRDPEIAEAPAEPADVTGSAAAKTAALEARDAAADRLAAARSRASDARGVAARIVETDAAIADDRAQLDVVGPLADVVRGGGSNALRMRLESYVLAARLEQIVDAANVRLSAMTDGRFVLQHDDGPAYRNARAGLGLEVLDEHTGRPRPVASLSGGETFLASLALALGLAEVVSAEAGGVRLDTLFVDEGFGSLDRETLDTAMETLDSLRAGGRTVGLISHVEAMQEDIPAGLHVERLPDGSSAVRPRVLAAV